MMMWKNKMATTPVEKLNFWMISKIGKESEKKTIGKEFRKMAISFNWKGPKKDPCNIAKSLDRGTELKKRSQSFWRRQTWKMWCKDLIKMRKIWCEKVLMKNKTQGKFWRRKTKRMRTWREERGASQWNLLDLVRDNGRELMWGKRRVSWIKAAWRMRWFR